MTKEVITYAELVRRMGDVFLFNKAPELDPDMYYEGLENGTLWANPEDEDSEEAVEIYQWYLIKESDADYLKRNTEELVFYSKVLDEYVWGVTHFGTSWDGVELEFGKEEAQDV